MPRSQSQQDSILVLGGARSGKSDYALQRAQGWGQRLIYLATAEANDAEMVQRIQNHRTQRNPRQWETLEEPLDVVSRLKKLDKRIDGVVLDCVTLWVSNALLNGKTDDLAIQVTELMEEIPLLPFHCVIVSNEVGLGLVPDNPLGRVYRDLLGTVNQRLAKVCDEVIFMAAGIPMQIKG